jgi:hypothetical protein
VGVELLRGLPGRDAQLLAEQRSKRVVDPTKLVELADWAETMLVY